MIVHLINQKSLIIMLHHAHKDPTIAQASM
jgi:hypothetical protein